MSLLSLYHPDKGMIITIDGPAGTGKSTVGRRLAQKLGYRFFESGSVYRALAVKAREAGVAPQDRKEVMRLAAELGGEVEPRREFYDPEISRLASVLSTDPEVRNALMGIQRRMGERGKIVVEGRDMGSVVFPEAEIKFFLKASLDERAHRRFLELRERDRGVSIEQVRSDIAERDHRDTCRKISPLVVPEGAVVIDTSPLSVDEVVAVLLAHVAQKCGGGENFPG